MSSIDKNIINLTLVYLLLRIENQFEKLFEVEY